MVYNMTARHASALEQNNMTMIHECRAGREGIGHSPCGYDDTIRMMINDCVCVYVCLVA